MVTIGGGYIKINKYHSYDGYNRGVGTLNGTIVTMVTLGGGYNKWNHSYDGHIKGNLQQPVYLTLCCWLISVAN
jgi:hypothetical protein